MQVGRSIVGLIGVALLAVGLPVAVAQARTAPASTAGPSTGGQAATGAPSAQPASSRPLGAGSGSASPPAGAEPADGPDSAAFVGPPEPPWLVGPPEPPWLVGPPAPGIQELADHLYVVSGVNGNVVARVTPAGVVVAGTPRRSTEAVAAWVGSVADEPVRHVIHAHRRSAERAVLPAAWRDARIIAHEPSGTSAPAAGAEPPDLTFTRGLSLFVGDAEVRLHHFAPAHTGDGVVVLFPDLRVLYAGDLVVRGMPFIDYAAGGSSRGWVETLDGILALDFDDVVPAYGPTLTKRDVQVFRDRLVTFRMRTMQLLYRGVAPEDAPARLHTADLDWPLAPGGPFAAQSFAALYDELEIERAEAREAAVRETDEADEPSGEGGRR